jgi:UDP-glucose 4-epimerase
MPQNEDTTPLNSRLPYAIVKNLGEAYIKAYEKEYGLPYTIFRFFNTYGPNQSEDFVVPKFVRCALRNDDITIYGDGMQTRTFCYIDDNVEACLAAHCEKKFINDTVNIGSDVEVSIAQLTQIIKAITKSESTIVHLPALPEGDMRKRCPDISKMRNLLSRDLIPIEEGIRRLVRFYQSSDGC